MLGSVPSFSELSILSHWGPRLREATPTLPRAEEAAPPRLRGMTPKSVLRSDPGCAHPASSFESELISWSLVCSRNKHLPRGAPVGVRVSVLTRTFAPFEKASPSAVGHRAQPMAGRPRLSLRTLPVPQYFLQRVKQTSYSLSDNPLCPHESGKESPQKRSPQKPRSEGKVGPPMLPTPPCRPHCGPR